jgi:hypothetical protein
MAGQSLELGREYPPESEGLLIEEILKISKFSMENKPHPPTLRDQHPKSHGYVKGEFIVEENIPDPLLKVGVFKVKKTYPVWIRFSNGGSDRGNIVPDTVGDIRGIAIKLMGVEGEQAISDSAHHGEQDFVLINSPTFFIRDVQGYIQFFPVLKAIQEKKITFNSDGSPKDIPEELKEDFGAIAYALKLVQKIKAKTVEPFSPLGIAYWSSTPYKLGDQAIKFSVDPQVTSEEVLNLEDFENKDNYLREVIARHLASKDAFFDFKVQLQKDASEMPVEDPTVEWDEQASPYVKVATIRIPQQDFDTEELKQLDEKQSFSPWNSLIEHQPLGGVNRARKIYTELAKIRNNIQYCSMPQTVERTFSSDVDPNRQQLILLSANKWLNGTVLHYFFFDQGIWFGSEAEKAVVRKAFETWKSIGIGLEFKEVSNRSEAEIRIGFLKGDGSWSYLGKGILDIPNNQRTMNFGWDISRSPREIDTAIHEIGHTLGFPHEHQNPNAGIVWDEDKVYSELAKPPNSWPRTTTFNNIIRKLDPDKVDGSPWDPNSVMHYPFQPGLIKLPLPFDKNGINPPGGLSSKDKEIALKYYPTLPEQLLDLIPFISVPLQLGKDQQQNFKIVPEATREYKFATLGTSDSVLGIFEKIDDEPRYVKADDDSGEDRNATLTLKLFKGREYILRVRVYHQQDEKVAVVMW